MFELQQTGKFNGFLTVHHSVDLNFHQLNAQFYFFNNITS
jgi:hypothetical protein